MGPLQSISHLIFFTFSSGPGSVHGSGVKSDEDADGTSSPNAILLHNAPIIHQIVLAMAVRSWQ